MFVLHTPHLEKKTKTTFYLVQCSNAKLATTVFLRKKRTSKLWGKKKAQLTNVQGKVVIQFALYLVDCMARFGANDK